jgi:amino-acid N-acetyltransferase
MQLFNNPDEQAVKRLLLDAELPVADLTPEHMQHFFGCGTPEAINGVIGLELFGDSALLRSLAVTTHMRECGLGKQLVAEAESYAREHGVKALYLLTTTAERFFDRIGYSRIERETVPESIKATREYGGICPASSAVMCKRLPAV